MGNHELPPNPVPDGLRINKHPIQIKHNSLNHHPWFLSANRHGASPYREGQPVEWVSTVLP